jgi:hypothetical protein
MYTHMNKYKKLKIKKTADFSTETLKKKGME